MEDTQTGQVIADAGAEPVETQEQQPVTPPPAPKISLAETIREAREARERHARAEQERNDYKTRAEKAEAALAAKEAANPRKDPLAWARAQKMTPEEQAEFGQTLLYDLVPDKAPPNFRVKLLEAKMERDAREREEKAKADAERARIEGEQRLLNDYQAGVQQAARSFAEGSHPESEAWFGGDRDAWARSLLATAQNLSQAAAKSGQQVDISPANVARVLEADIAERQARRDKLRAGKAKNVAEGDTSPGTEQSTGNPTSTKGLSTGGPRGPALTEKERIERAVAAAFKTGR